MGLLMSCCTRSPSPTPPPRPHRIRSRSPSKHNVSLDTSTISQPYALGFQPPCASNAGRPKESGSRSRTLSLPRWIGGSVRSGRSVSTTPDGEADHMQGDHDPEAQRLQHDYRAGPESAGTGGSGATRDSRSGNGNGNGSERRREAMRKALSTSTLWASYTAAGASADEVGVRSHGRNEGDPRDGPSSPASILQHRPLTDATHRSTLSDPTTREPSKGAATSSMPTIPAQVVRFETPGLYDRFPTQNHTHTHTYTNTHTAQSSPRSSPSPPSSPTPSMSPILQISSRRKTTSLPSQPHSRHSRAQPQMQMQMQAKRQVRVGDIPFPLRIDPPRSLRSPLSVPSEPSPRGISSSGWGNNGR